MESMFFLVGSYILVSTFFFFFPNFLHKKKSQSIKKTEFLVISHRGGSGENIENTITAFQHSKNIGVDIIELDVHLTRDGIVVVSHDNNLKRSTGVDKFIDELDYNELPELLENTYTSPPFSNHHDLYKQNQIDSTYSRRIPMLEEIFEEFPQLPVNLDIKYNSDELIEKVNFLVKKYNREDNLVWGSFNDKVTKKINKLNPNVNLMFSLLGVVRLLIFHLTGLLSFIPLKETHFEIIMPDMILKYNKDLPITARIGFWLVKTFFIKKSFVRHLQKRGILVYFWVLNTNEEFEYAFNLGVNGIITDYPSRLIEFLNQNSKCK